MRTTPPVYSRPARTYLPIGRGWPRLAEAGGRPALALALAGDIKAGGRRGRVGRSLWAAAFHMAVHSTPTCWITLQRTVPLDGVSGSCVPRSTAPPLRSEKAESSTTPLRRCTPAPPRCANEQFETRPCSATMAASTGHTCPRGAALPSRMPVAALPACVSGQPTAVAVPLKALSTSRTPDTLMCGPRSRPRLRGVSRICGEPFAAKSSP
jgi:hypothetical protein